MRARNYFLALVWILGGLGAAAVVFVSRNAGVVVLVIAAVILVTVGTTARATWQFRRRFQRYLARGRLPSARADWQLGQLRDGNFQVPFTLVKCLPSGVEARLLFGILGRFVFTWDDIESAELCKPTLSNSLVTSIRWQPAGAPAVTFSPWIGDAKDLIRLLQQPR